MAEIDAPPSAMVDSDDEAVHVDDETREENGCFRYFLVFIMSSCGKPEYKFETLPRAALLLAVDSSIHLLQTGLFM